MSVRSLPPVDPLAPTSASVTPYDRTHYLLYARLIDAEDGGGDWKVAAGAILECDVAHDPEAAKLCYDSHLARARWIVGEGLDSLLHQAEA